METRIEQLLEEMSLDEKVSLLAGASMWTTVPIERLDIPAIKVTDGPNGARGGGSFIGGDVTSACFPVGISLASTWNIDLVEQVGQALAEEAKSKGAQMLLAPTVNIHRSPLNGRNFECYSEDPYLSARMAVAYINGLQSRNVGATVKHFVCNDSEFERNSIDSEVDERALREIYLPPFAAAVKEAKSWGVMSAYNKVNGVFAGENAAILIDILKKEWGFDGIVMSDWYGTKSTATSVNGGLDLEMPGPAQFRGDRLLKAVEAGEADEEAINEAVRRMLRTIIRSGAVGSRESQPEQAVDRPEHRAIIRRAATEGIVLLKNRENVLPLDMDSLKRIAVIGPNAKTAQIMGGGSSQVNAHYVVTPFDGIAKKVGSAVDIGYAIGCTNHRILPPFDPALLAPSGGDGRSGLAITYFNSLDLSGDPVHHSTASSSEQVWSDEVAPTVERGRFSARLTGRFTAQESGAYTFGLSSAGLARLYVDGKEIVDNWTQQTPGDSYFGMGSTEATAQVEMVAGQPYELSVEYSAQGTSMLAAVRLGCLPPVAENAIEQAAALADNSDVALLFVGLNADWESEGYDRPDMELAGDQVALIEAVAAANPRTVVVLQSGSPISMRWLDEVAALVQAWYPGQECGNAIADVLFGDANPSGKLSQTFPVRLEDNPAYINYPGENGKVRYGEGIFVGYRYYEKKKIAPLFPFGFGLSYTTFVYESLRLSTTQLSSDDELTATVDVTNTGRLRGQEVVQLYVSDVASSLMRPEKELKAFAKVTLEPGETQRVSFPLNRASLAYWDDAQSAWVAEEGDFIVLVGSSSQDIRAQAQFTLMDTVAFDGAQRIQRPLSVQNTLNELLANAESRAVLDRHLPGFSEHPRLGMALGFSPVQLAAMAPDQFPQDALQAIAADLEAAFGEAQRATDGQK